MKTSQPVLLKGAETKIAINTSILLSFFARKKGPILFYSYPEKALIQSELMNITQNMEQAFKKEFFILQSSTIPTSLNYYFEIPSEWARGKKEMLLISIIINKPITQIIEDIVKPICLDFVTQLNDDENSFKAIYYNEIDKFPEKDKVEIKMYSDGLKERIKQLYILLIQSLQF